MDHRGNEKDAGYVDLKQLSTPSNPSSGYDRLYVKSDDTLYRLNSSGVESVIGSGSGGFLAYSKYAPVTNTIYAASSSTLADVDATNLKVTFTAPASGNVVITVCLTADCSGAGTFGFVGLREGSSDISSALFTTRDTSQSAPLTFKFYITGISAGSHTYKLSHARTGSGSPFRILVGPGTVDATNWAGPCQFFVEDATVNASAAGSSEFVLLADSLLSSPAASFNFTSIPANYKHLRLLFSLRSDQSSDQEIDIQVNGDTTSGHYAFVRHYRDSANNDSWVDTASDSKMYMFDMPSNSRTTGVCVAGEITIPDYASTNFAKAFVLSAASSFTNVMVQYLSNGMWLSTAAINRITLTPLAGNFQTGSRCSLFGMS